MDKIRDNIDQVKDYVHRKSIMRNGAARLCAIRDS